MSSESVSISKSKLERILELLREAREVLRGERE